MRPRQVQHPRGRRAAHRDAPSSSSQAQARAPPCGRELRTWPRPGIRAVTAAFWYQRRRGAFSVNTSSRLMHTAPSASPKAPAGPS